MKTIKKYDISGKVQGEVSLSDALVGAEGGAQMVKEYLLALRQNQRQWSANTKDRGEVSHSNRKPHKQKKLGRARQGSLAAPQYRGGGVVFGPKPKFDQHVRINRKERQAAVRALLAGKIREGHLIVLTSLAMKDPKTRIVAKFLQSRELSGNVLFIAEEPKERGAQLAFVKSCRNIPRVAVSHVGALNGYDLARAQTVVVTESALIDLQERLHA